MNQSHENTGLMPIQDQSSNETGRIRSRVMSLAAGLVKMTAAGLFLMIAFFLAEMHAPSEYKPSTVVAEAEANFERVRIDGAIMAKAEAQRLINEAAIEGQRESEILFQERMKALEVRTQAELKEIEYNYQRKVIIAQGNVQDAVKAYDRLYERTNMIQQVAHQMEANLMDIKQRAIKQTQGGRTFVTNLADIGCYFSPEACEVSRQTRQKIANDLVDVSRYRSGEVARDYLKGVEDPAQLRARLIPTIQ